MAIKTSPIFFVRCVISFLCGFQRRSSIEPVRMAMVNREAKRDVTVSKDALLKSYSKRLKDDVRSLADNFSAIVKTCRSPALLSTLFCIL